MSVNITDGLGRPFVKNINIKNTKKYIISCSSANDENAFIRLFGDNFSTPIKDIYFSNFINGEYEFISDSFNLFGINNTVHLYRQAIDIILDNNRNTLTDCIDNVFYWVLAEFDEGELEANAVFVYGLIHARYILTTAGLEAMVNLRSCFYV